MADTILRDIGGIVRNGGGILRVIETNDSGTFTAGDFTDLGFIEVTEFYDDITSREIYDETGNLVKDLYENRTVGMDVTLMQTNVEVIDFIKASADRYYTLYYKMSKTSDVNGKTQELFAAIARIKPAFRLKSSDKKIALQIRFSPNPAQVTIASPATNFGSVRTSDVVIGAGEYYKVVET